jgi:hypothetical protein
MASEPPELPGIIYDAVGRDEQLPAAEDARSLSPYTPNDGIEYGGLPVKSAVITLCGNHFRGPFRLGNRTLLTIAAADTLAYDLACHRTRGLDGIRSRSPD